MDGPSVQPPCGDERKGALYAAGKERQGSSGAAGGLGWRLDQLRQAYRQFDAFADLLRPGAARGRGFAQLLQPGEQGLHVEAQEPLPICRIAARARELSVGNWRISAHEIRPLNKAP